MKKELSTCKDCSTMTAHIILVGGREIIRKVKLLMSFPHDPGIREKLFTQFVTGVNTIGGGAEFAKLERQEQRNMHKATIAGTILDDIFKAWKWNPEADFGVKKAIGVLVKYPEYHSRFDFKIIDGQWKKIPLSPKRKLSERTALTYWKKYKCVAHLFAAGFHHESEEGHKKVVAKRRFNPDHFKPVNFPGFLALAKRLQDFAINYTPARAKEPLIPKDEIWWIEPDFELPSIEIVRPEEIPRWVQDTFRKK